MIISGLGPLSGNANIDCNIYMESLIELMEPVLCNTKILTGVATILFGLRLRTSYSLLWVQGGLLSTNPIILLTLRFHPLQAMRNMTPRPRACL